MKELLISDHFWRSFYALCFILTALALTHMILKFFKLRSGKKGKASITFTSALPIDDKHALRILQWHGQEYLILLGMGHSLVIDQRPLETSHTLPEKDASTPIARNRVPPTFQKPYELTRDHALS